MQNLHEVMQRRRWRVHRAGAGGAGLTRRGDAGVDRAAREALQQRGLWEWVLPKLVLGENISQATQFVATGAAQAGIPALSLALASRSGAKRAAYRATGQPACAAASAHGAAEICVTGGRGAVWPSAERRGARGFPAS